jgi:hypothetical protein
MRKILNGAMARIVLRYGVGILVGAGWLSSELGGQITSDPDVAVVVDMAGFAVGALAVEGWYWLAKRFGWAT